MAPSSARRQSARKRQPTARQRGQSGPASSSPSRPSKRRKVNAARSPKEPKPDHTNVAEDDETSDDEAEIPLTEVVDKVIEVLHEPTEHVSMVAKEYGNENNPVTDSSVSAYAKIAGRNWTFYVQDTIIRVGRRPDPKHAQETDAPTHIDLGPSKHVSRLHGTVYYDSAQEIWALEVGGRNGIRVDETLCRKGQKVPLRSGNVLKVDETEMIFILPSGQPTIHEEYSRRLNQPPIIKEDPDMKGLPSRNLVAGDFKQATHVSPYGDSSANGVTQIDAPSSSANRQSTPNPIMQAPYLAQSAAPAQTLSTTPQRGPTVLLENSDSQIDYSHESMRDVKPPMSYATLIAQAILAGPNEKSSLNGIYEWIKSNFAYYRHLEAGWQNSIRHNLSLNQAFQRVGRDTHEPGKGGLWYIVEDRIEEFRKQGLKMTSRGGARQSSNPASPVPKRSPKKKTPPRRSNQHTGKSTSHLGSGLDEQHESKEPLDIADEHTPSRVPPGGRADSRDHHHLSSDASPVPTRSTYLSRAAQGADSPPALAASTSLFNREDIDFGSSSLFTPAPQRHEPRITAPSTAKLPSKYLPQSSPAPFWRNIGNTPLAMTSPAKAIASGDGDGDTEADHAGPDGESTQSQRQLQSSSPPPPSVNGSPTRARPKVEATGVGIAGARARRLSTPPAPAPPTRQIAQPPEEGEEEDDGELDLMGNFPKIGENMISNSAR